MAKGRCQAKSKKNEGSPVSRRPVKSKLADAATDKNADKQASHDHVKCLECGSLIADDTRALNCEKCGKFWKCSGCVGLRSSTYDDLVSEAGKELHWFCVTCYEGILNPVSDGKVIEMLSTLTQQMLSIEDKLDKKADAARVAALEEMVKGIETKVSDGYKGVVKSLEQSKSDVTAVFEKSKLDVSTVQGCVEGVLRVQSREEKEEEEEKKKRKTNVIIHGLCEPTAVQPEDRKKEDCDLTQDLFHILSCDDVSVNHITRLGSPRTEPDAKPRPVKLNLASEEARITILKGAKNLRASQEERWKNVFIHQDLTPREREVRRLLVQELKTRRAAGETNLIIANGKIVRKIDYIY
jgi:hypothetical protein